LPVACQGKALALDMGVGGLKWTPLLGPVD
jgi:hypothetical protein